MLDQLSSPVLPNTSISGVQSEIQTAQNKFQPCINSTLNFTLIEVRPIVNNNEFGHVFYN